MSQASITDRVHLPPRRVRTLTGKEIELNVEGSDQVLCPPTQPYQSSRTDLRLGKVSKIKELVEEKEGIPPAQQRLIYGGKQMYVFPPSPLPTYWLRVGVCLMSGCSEQNCVCVCGMQGRRQDGGRLQPRGRRDAALGSCAQGRAMNYEWV